MSEQGSQMERREFLGTVAAGSVAGAAAVGSSGCTAMLLRRLAEEVDPEAIEALLARLDAGLDEIDRHDVAGTAIEGLFDGDILEDLTPEDEARLEQSRRSSRRILRALLVAGMIHDLPRAARSSPGIRRAIERLEPELDETMVEATRLIAGCPDSVRDGLGRMMRDDPDLAMRMGEDLDAQAREVGMGSGGRAKLRQTCTHLTGRLRRQPVSLLFEECLDKTEREVARHGVDVGLWRALTTEAPLHALWMDDPRPTRGRAKSPEEGGAEEGGVAGGAEVQSEAESGEGDGAQPDTETLIRELGSSDVNRRIAAARALGERRAAEAVPALTASLRADPNAAARGWMVRALHQIGTPEALRALELARDDPDERVRQLVEDLVPRPRPAAPAPSAPPSEGPTQEQAEAEESGNRLYTHARNISIGANVHQGVGAILLGVGAAMDSIDGAIIMTVGTIVAGLGFILIIVGFILLGLVRRRRREAGGAPS